ncbi:MAG: cell division protein FtsW [Candidatus Marinimicrobia bacterium]|nr:cell division protein FtsW [Candidatus Neomarinimicrobiota bacterium]
MSLFSKKHDTIFLYAVLILVAMGIIFQFSASSKINVSSEQYYNPNHFLINHLVRLAVAILIALPFYFIHYKKLKKYTPYLLFITLGLLIFALIYNKMHPHPTGTARWITIGPMTIQPSEFAKLALIFFIAAFYEDFQNNLNSFAFGFLPVIIVAVIYFFLIVAGKDFSTAGVTILIAGIVLIAGGAKFRHWVWGIVLFALSSIGAIIIRPYRITRIKQYLHILKGDIPIKEMPYQIRHSLVSLGNGRLIGTGLGDSTGKNEFLPEPNTDFIFSIVGEETGFLGALFILGLFLFIFYRGLKIAERSDDIFGSLLAFGLISSLFVYTLLNIGVTCGLLPVTGLPLPFISYGGTAVLFNSIAVALLLNISKGKLNNESIIKSRIINTHAE